MSANWFAPASERECGEREPGKAYVEVGTSDGGAEIENFFIDSPVPVPDGLSLSVRGMNVLQLVPGGPFHLIDVVGQNNYPNAADILEEGRSLGFSRKIQRTAEFDRLGPDSRLILVHARGYIENFEDYYVRIEAAMGSDLYQDFWHCPRCRTEHVNLGRPDAMCAGLWYVDLVEGIEEVGRERAGFSGFPTVQRTMTHASYYGAARPDGLVPEYRPAFIASLPISRLVVIESEDGSHEQTLAAARRSALAVDVVEA
jgi:hypothetical protein